VQGVGKTTPKRSSRHLFLGPAQPKTGGAVHAMPLTDFVLFSGVVLLAAGIVMAVASLLT